ncbi:Lipase ROG1-like protein [Elsinoe fawcettii]|nr:Lipase ROG1-like protein [Elsinoe fawcettii]
MLLVHQSGSVHVGEVVRYTLTYTPSADRILPSPAHLFVKVKNTSPIPLRAAYLHGPYSLHVSAYPSTFNPHQKVADPELTGVPEFEPFLKAGAHWTCKLTVPESIRETGANFANGRGSMDSMTEKGREKERKSVTWIIEVASQVIFSTSAGVHFEVLVGRDERSLDLGFAAVAGHGHGGPGDVKDHKRAKGDRSEKRRSTKGVYSRAVKLVVEDTEELWDKPRLPQKVGIERAKSIEEKNEKKTKEEVEEKEEKKQKVHLVILTHGLHSNLSADMLYMKESIDATVAQARAEARERRSKRKAQKEGGTKKSSEGTEGVEQDDQAATQPLTGGQEELEDEEDEEQVIVRGFSGNAVRTERGIQYLGKRLAKYVLHLTYPSQPYLPIKKTMSQSISSKFGGSQDQKVADTKCPASHSGSTIHHDAEHPHENNQAYQFTSISFIGHSLGGLVQLYAIAYIQKHAPGFFKLIQPVNFVCMASPLLGLSNENPMYIKFALDFGLVGRTGQDLGLTWRAPTIAKSGWSAMGGVFGTGQKDQKEEDPGAKPLLRILPTGPAHQVLHLFANRTLYSNVVNDGIVPLRTSCLLFLDWKGLGKVEKFRRENGLIGTVVEWGWAEVTGANADRDMSVSPRPRDAEFSDSGTNTPTRQGDGETVPQPSDSVTEEDNNASGALGPSVTQYLQPRTHNDASKEPRNNDTSPQQTGATTSMFSDFWNFFKPAQSQPAEKKSPKALKALQRAQTLSKEEEEEVNKAAAATDNSSIRRPSFSRGTTENPTMRPTKSRPVASRGDSLDNQGSSLSAPPKTSVFEAASDILHPPVPSTQWIIDPASRPRTIFHDRVYHPSDIPPPPVRRPSRLSRSFSSEQNANSITTTKSPSLRSTDSSTSLASDAGNTGGMKVEEKIARAYHRDLSWRKVLVKLEPDAHNNMIVRRMFANAYGWPVVKHLCDTHFGDTYSAKTRDEDEDGRDRANPDSEPASAHTGAKTPSADIKIKKREGEEVAGQTAKKLERTGSEVREAGDELGSLHRSTEGAAKVEEKHRHETQDTWGEHFFSESSSDDEGVYRADGGVDVSVSEASPVLQRGKGKARPEMHLLHTGNLPSGGKGGSPDIILSPSELQDRLVAEPGDISEGESLVDKGKAVEERQPLGSPVDLGLRKDVNEAMTESVTEDKGEGLGILERVVDATAKIEGQADKTEAEMKHK